MPLDGMNWSPHGGGRRGYGRSFVVDTSEGSERICEHEFDQIAMAMSAFHGHIQSTWNYPTMSVVLSLRTPGSMDQILGCKPVGSDVVQFYRSFYSLDFNT